MEDTEMDSSSSADERDRERETEHDADGELVTARAAAVVSSTSSSVSGRRYPTTTTTTTTSTLSGSASGKKGKYDFYAEKRRYDSNPPPRKFTLGQPEILLEKNPEMPYNYLCPFYGFHSFPLSSASKHLNKFHIDEMSLYRVEMSDPPRLVLRSMSSVPSSGSSSSSSSTTASASFGSSSSSEASPNYPREYVASPASHYPSMNVTEDYDLSRPGNAARGRGIPAQTAANFDSFAPVAGRGSRPPASMQPAQPSYPAVGAQYGLHNSPQQHSRMAVHSGYPSSPQQQQQQQRTNSPYDAPSPYNPAFSTQNFHPPPPPQPMQPPLQYQPMHSQPMYAPSSLPQQQLPQQQLPPQQYMGSPMGYALPPQGGYGHDALMPNDPYRYSPHAPSSPQPLQPSLLPPPSVPMRPPGPSYYPGPGGMDPATTTAPAMAGDPALLAFLSEKQLTKYHPQLVKNGFDSLATLVDLSALEQEEMLDAVGVTAMGHRMAFKKGLERLQRSGGGVGAAQPSPYHQRQQAYLPPPPQQQQQQQQQQPQPPMQFHPQFPGQYPPPPPVYGNTGYHY